MPLTITKAKPNPSGKDRIGRTLTPPAQLAGEWVDIKNTGTTAISFANLALYHIAYTGFTSQWELVTDFTGELPAGQTVRIHSGHQIALTQMHPVDVAGADYHVFSDKDYVWNNDRIDKPSILNKATNTWLDQAEYSANPGEGRILTRVGTSLV
jgi:hypothetical protein